MLESLLNVRTIDSYNLSDAVTCHFPKILNTTASHHCAIVADNYLMAVSVSVHWNRRDEKFFSRWNVTNVAESV